jgi:hypothetical protein
MRWFNAAYKKAIGPAHGRKILIHFYRFDTGGDWAGDFPRPQPDY